MEQMSTKTPVGDIAQDRTGWFFRITETGTECLSTMAGVQPQGSLVVLVHADGTPTGHGDPLAARVAAVMARRYR
jgi:hypothetical protein